MSAPVCYVMRSDRGARLSGLRVLDRVDEASWRCAEIEGPATESDARQAAEWLADRLSKNGRALSRLVIDVDGAVCSWVTTSESSPAVLRALVERRFDEEDSGHAGRFQELPGELALQVLGAERGAGQAKNGKKAGVEASRVSLASVPVVPARLLIDHLDRLGVRVGTVEALWQACAAAWDPASTLGGSGGERVIAESRGVVAVVLIDPVGRLVWSWSSGGDVLAGGSVRVQSRRDEAGERAIVAGSDVGRVVTEWLAWSVQLGRAPGRVLIVGEPGDEGLSAGEIGQGFVRAMPGVSVDFVRDADPIGTTLAKLADRDATGGRGIEELANRPGRSHRAMYRWSAAALLGGAAVLGVGAWRISSLSAGLKSQAAAVSNQYIAMVQEQNLALPTALLDLEQKIGALQRSRVDLSTVIQPPRPVLAELEALSYVLASDEIVLKEISVTSVALSVKVEVPDTPTFEALSQALRSVSGSVIADWRPNVQQRGARLECTFTGQWPAREGGS